MFFCNRIFHVYEKSCRIKLMRMTGFSLFTFFAFCFLFFSACRPAAAPVSVSDKPILINNVPQANVPTLKNIENIGWQNFDGKQETLGELKGKVVVLDFWATYCKPCLEEIPHLVKLQNENADLKIVGLHAGALQISGLARIHALPTPISASAIE